MLVGVTFSRYMMLYVTRNILRRTLVRKLMTKSTMLICYQCTANFIFYRVHYIRKRTLNTKYLNYNLIRGGKLCFKTKKQ